MNLNVEKRHCCQIKCSENATHSIFFSNSIEDYTDMCKKHVGEYLPDDKEATVVPIISEEFNLEECIGCSDKFDYETMKQDNIGENYCESCASEMFPIMKAEYDELLKNGEIEPNE